MVNEFALRRRDFLPGPSIRLANGQWWTFPAPAAPVGEGHPDYAATVAAVHEADDEVERIRAELGLAICLLERNSVEPD